MNVVSKPHPKSSPWRIALALVTLGMLAWGIAASAFYGATGAKADSNLQYRDADIHFLIQKDGQWYTVQVEFFMVDKGDGTFEADAAAAQAEMISRFPGAIEIPEGSVEAQYVTTGFKWVSGISSWGYNGAGANAGVSGTALAAIKAAAQTWGQQGAQFAFSGGAPSSANTGACGGGTDGLNTVGWGNQSGSVLAVTCSWFSNTGNPWKPAAEFDMQIDPEWTWSTGTPIQVDLQSVALHEFGHALGLSHSAQSSAVMFPSYSTGSNKRTPAQDDIDGILAIYGATGGGATNTPTNSPTNTPVPSATNTPSNTSTPSATNTPGSTNTPAGGPTAIPTSTPTRTPSPTPGAGSPTALPTNSPTPLPTSNATATPTTSATSTPSPTPTAVATSTSTPTPAPGGGGGSSLPIIPGTNLVAWPGVDTPPAIALAGVPNLKIVYAWNPTTGQWSRFIPGGPAFLNTLPTLKQGISYWFIASGAGSVPFKP